VIGFVPYVLPSDPEDSDVAVHGPSQEETTPRPERALILGTGQMLRRRGRR
jgi:hypothetical protein